jgi:hypothetical protein
MRRSTLALFALLAVAATGCDKVKLAIDKIKEKISPSHPAARPGVPRDTTKRPVAAGQAPTPPATQPAGAQPAGRTFVPGGRPPAPGMGGAAQTPAPPPQAPGLPHPPRDVPYISADTGTIAPGMTEREVYSMWGGPIAVRRSGEYTYLYFRNSCEHSCGKQDLVILQNGKVVDAVLRWPGHGYSGQSSSPPPDRGPGGATRTGDSLRIKQ